jgi:hypothetical protein
MKKSVLALAALATIGFTGAAVAGDGTTTESWATTSTPVTATAPTAMTDSDMDKVTAGAGFAYGGGTGSGVLNNGHSKSVTHWGAGHGQGGL